jgi:hypothetical protein
MTAIAVLATIGLVLVAVIGLAAGVFPFWIAFLLLLVAATHAFMMYDDAQDRNK